MMKFQHRVTIPKPLQPPHLFNFEVSIFHYQNEISLTKFCVLKIQHESNAEIEVKNHHSNSLQSTKMRLESETCADCICVAMLQTLQTIAKNTISGANQMGKHLNANIVIRHLLVTYENTQWNKVTQM